MATEKRPKGLLKPSAIFRINFLTAIIDLIDYWLRKF